MISAILLSAGLSKRFKNGNKLIYKFNRQEILIYSLKNILKSKIDEIIVVTGKDHNRIKRILPKYKKIKIIKSLKYKSGLSFSIRSGIKHLNLESNGFFICLGDMPFFSHKYYNKMINHFNKSNKYPLVPFFNDKMRNPVLFPMSYLKKLKDLRGDVGAKKIIIQNKYNKIRFSRYKNFYDIDIIDDMKYFN